MVSCCDGNSNSCSNCTSSGGYMGLAIVIAMMVAMGPVTRAATVAVMMINDRVAIVVAMEAMVMVAVKSLGLPQATLG